MKTRVKTYVYCLVLLTLTACAGPQFGALGPKYAPMDNGVAEMTTPEKAPGPPGTSYCRLFKGQAHFTNGWKNLATTTFILPPENRVQVNMQAAGLFSNDTQPLQIFYDRGHQKILFCPIVTGPDDRRIPCASLYVMDDDLSDGIKRTLDIPGTIEGALITCADQKGNLKS